MCSTACHGVSLPPKLGFIIDAPTWKAACGCVQTVGHGQEWAGGCVLRAGWTCLPVVPALPRRGDRAEGQSGARGVAESWWVPQGAEEMRVSAHGQRGRGGVCLLLALLCAD